MADPWRAVVYGCRRYGALLASDLRIGYSFRDLSQPRPEECQWRIEVCRDRQAIVVSCSEEALGQGAFADTENALDAVQRLREQLDQAEARRVAAAESLRIAHDRYRNGYSSYLEELDGQRTNFSAYNAVL